ncbi:MAG: peptide chain release factor N(5)-glutamine methyltransferase [Patescibacteria group bacterium]|nr:peptide chain release factor N(5)-glutamine methyltransferase [Patescibacteria group bacterium]
MKSPKKRLPRQNKATPETVAALLASGRQQLGSHVCPDVDAGREAELLLATAMKRDRVFLFAHPEATVTKTVANKFRDLVRRRLKHEPIAYLVGFQPFVGRDFKVNRRTLIPRPATEHIVTAAIEAAKAVPDTAIADIGTGSGCIALTLAAEMTGMNVFATDASASALVIARANARKLNLSKQVIFLKGNLAAPVLKKISSVQPLIVVANLPYISTAHWRKLRPGIKKYEPRSALVAGRDGLDDYRALLAQLVAAKRRAPTTIIMEILPKQFRPLAAVIRRSFGAEAKPIKNLAGIAVGLTALLK